jgi:hypothetical protein
MSESASTGRKGTGNDQLGNPKVPRLGIDAEGARHYYDEEHERILVTQDGDVEHVEEDIAWSDVQEWKAFVRERRGLAVWGAGQFAAELQTFSEAIDDE